MKVKVCGLKSFEEVIGATNAGADYLGFVFYNKSPRNISLERGERLLSGVPKKVSSVVLVVDPDDDLLNDIKQFDYNYIQLHGTETIERVVEIKSILKRPIIKAIGVGDTQDLKMITPYSSVCDQILIDAKAPINATMPGGNGISIDWKILEKFQWPCPWILAGGLHIGNVEHAISITNADQVDVSSGIEQIKGKKDLNKIKAFISAVKGNKIA